MTTTVLAIGGALILVALWFLTRIVFRPGWEKSPLSREEVALCLQFIVEGQSYVWDDFTEVPIRDAELDSIRQRVIGLAREFPPTRPDEYVSDQGKKVLLEIIRELRSSDGF